MDVKNGACVWLTGDVEVILGFNQDTVVKNLFSPYVEDIIVGLSSIYINFIGALFLGDVKMSLVEC